MDPYAALIAPGDDERPCLLLDDDVVWTYRDLRRRAARVASVLDGRGVGLGDRVVVQVDKSADAIALYVACLHLGAVYVPLNIAYTEHEVEFFVGDAEPALVVARPGTLTDLDAPVTHLGADGDGALADAADVADPHLEPVSRGPDDWVAMLYTSGTTGRSKGAMLSARNLVHNARALVDAWRFEPDDVLVHALPVFHVHGLFVALHCALAVGAAVRLHRRFDVDAIIDDLARSTVFMGVPTHYHRLLTSDRLVATSVEGMRLFTSGSAPLPAAEHQAFAERTGHRIVERYGMTETMILTSNPYDGARVAGTVGFPLDGVEVRVVDDDGRAVAPGTPGGVEVRTPGLFLGYWGLPERTAEATRPGGWFATGDVGEVDQEGRLTLLGRAGDLIISGGLNVYPSEVEAVLDAVDGVVESAVVGTPDADFGERVVAVLVCDGDGPSDDALTSACNATLARFKHPVRYVVVDELPRNAMGKVQKGVLREFVGQTAP